MQGISLDQVKAGNISVALKGGVHRIAQIESEHAIAAPGQGRAYVTGAATGIQNPGVVVIGRGQDGSRHELGGVGDGESVDDAFPFEPGHAACPLQIKG